MGWTMRGKGYPISPFQQHSDATDGLRRGWVSDPIQTINKKTRPKLLCWTRVAIVTSLPLGTRSAGNRPKLWSVCVNTCMCPQIFLDILKKLLCHQYCFSHEAQVELIKRVWRSFLVSVLQRPFDCPPTPN